MHEEIAFGVGKAVERMSQSVDDGPAIYTDPSPSPAPHMKVFSTVCLLRYLHFLKSSISRSQFRFPPQYRIISTLLVRYRAKSPDYKLEFVLNSLSVPRQEIELVPGPVVVHTIMILPTRTIA